jgi:hypothetical protein
MNIGSWALGIDKIPPQGGIMTRQLVLGILLAAGALTISVTALQQPQAPAAGQAARVVEVEKLKDTIPRTPAGASRSSTRSGPSPTSRSR